MDILTTVLGYLPEWHHVVIALIFMFIGAFALALWSWMEIGSEDLPTREDKQ